MVAALGFGLFFVGIDAGSDESAAWAVTAARSASVPVVVVAALITSTALRPPRAMLPMLVGVGVFDTLSNVSVAAATTYGAVGIVAVLSSLYPVVTVVLAWIVLGERLSAVKRVGGAVALAGAALVAARLDVEADVHDVAVLDDVGLPLEPLEPPPRGLRMRAALEEIVPVDDLGADEAARDVRVDRLGGLERGLAVPERPRARLRVADREERDEPERVLETNDDVVEGGRSRAELGCLLRPRAPRAPSRARSRSRSGRSRAGSAASS